ncbi:MAG TPA: GTP cyclohydrolase I [Polyangiales bacterium]
MEKLTGDPPPTAAAEVDLAAAARAIEDFLRALGHPVECDPQLADTGRLVAEAFYRELLAGHRMNEREILADSVAATGGDLVVVRDLDVTCICPHHLLPSSGVLHIAYAPRRKVVGFGAIARLAQMFSRRLILQETLCEQIAAALEHELDTAASGCIAELAPSCLTARGERPSRARVLTFATTGRLRDDEELRREFFALAGVKEAS